MIFKKDLATVLRTLEKTITDLAIVADQQSALAHVNSEIIVDATIARQEADDAATRANRVAAKLEELLK